jgi:phosphocarrier protein FPr
VDETPSGAPEEERARLHAARDAVRGDLLATERDLRARGRTADADIFAAHVLLLDDLTKAAGIADGKSAGAALRDAADETAAAFRALDDPYLQQRAVDVEDVARRVLRRLAGKTTMHVAAGIVLAEELTPGDVAALEGAEAIVAARGGVTDHASIIAGGLGIPVVVGVGPGLRNVAEGVVIGVDGETVDPQPDVAAFERKRDEAAQQREAALAAARRPVTYDGRRIEVLANAGSPADARAAVENGADGIGLLRTEFLFLDRATPPDEDEQVAVLTEIAEAMEGRRVIVRTLDAGADKPLPFLPQDPEVNPYLGLRGIRLSLAHPELFATQLSAIKRIAANHPIAVMFPMVATPEELAAARRLLGDVNFPVGVMVEVPALALQAQDFDVDFFSVGTNDLAQYTMAAERGNAKLAPLLGQALPALLELITKVTATGKPVGVCGELAGDPEVAPQLVQTGVSSLSMAPGRVPAVKAALSR